MKIIFWGAPLTYQRVMKMIFEVRTFWDENMSEVRLLEVLFRKLKKKNCADDDGHDYDSIEILLG